MCPGVLGCPPQFVCLAPVTRGSPLPGAFKTDDSRHAPRETRLCPCLCSSPSISFRESTCPGRLLRGRAFQGVHVMLSLGRLAQQSLPKSLPMQPPDATQRMHELEASSPRRFVPALFSFAVRVRAFQLMAPVARRKTLVDRHQGLLSRLHGAPVFAKPFSLPALSFPGCLSRGHGSFRSAAIARQPGLYLHRLFALTHRPVRARLRELGTGIRFEDSVRAGLAWGHPSAARPESMYGCSASTQERQIQPAGTSRDSQRGVSFPLP
jgi:hypothetical protein